MRLVTPIQTFLEQMGAVNTSGSDGFTTCSLRFLDGEQVTFNIRYTSPGTSADSTTVVRLGNIREVVSESSPGTVGNPPLYRVKLLLQEAVAQQGQIHSKPYSVMLGELVINTRSNADSEALKGLLDRARIDPA